MSHPPGRLVAQRFAVRIPREDAEPSQRFRTGAPALVPIAGDPAGEPVAPRREPAALPP